MIKKVDHVSIAVNSLEEGLKTFENLLGIKPSHTEEVPDQGIKAAMIMVGDVEIELIEPTNPESGVAKFLEKKGEGIHHICFEVDDVDKELESLATKGVELIDKQGRKGLAGKIGFLHPRSTKGVLIELAQKI
ncbi:MAG: methylmalonyl-CoA epimerase [Dehalococcoidia bacterium]|nr:MAG: methylmalonyl-CoA epimerase [Dehalococcoidia bacterium]UCG84012.1 MAG: methylmalonyl-CoA epimerase [Dehalococcoidia bacterium]